MTILEIFCDGACRNNQSKENLGAYACILKYGDKEKSFGVVVENTTNNVMELSSVIYALNKVKNKTLPTELITDSQYVVSGINEWSKKWKENGWKTTRHKPIENMGEWLWLLDLIDEFSDIKIIKCQGHTNHDYNNRVDALCNKLMDEHTKGKVYE